jgi:hypothetical protein
MKHVNFAGPTPIVTKFVQDYLAWGGSTGFSEREKKLLSLAIDLERRMRLAEQVIEKVIDSATVYHDLEIPSILNSYIEFADKNDDELI